MSLQANQQLLEELIPIWKASWSHEHILEKPSYATLK